MSRLSAADYSRLTFNKGFSFACLRNIEQQNRFTAKIAPFSSGVQKAILVFVNHPVNWRSFVESQIVVEHDHTCDFQRGSDRQQQQQQDGS